MAEKIKTKTKERSKKNDNLSLSKSKAVSSEVEILKALDKLPNAPDDSLESLHDSEAQSTELQLENVSENKSSVQDIFRPGEESQSINEKTQVKVDSLNEKDQIKLDSPNEKDCAIDQTLPEPIDEVHSRLEENETADNTTNTEMQSHVPLSAESQEQSSPLECSVIDDTAKQKAEEEATNEIQATTDEDLESNLSQGKQDLKQDANAIKGERADAGEDFVKAENSTLNSETLHPTAANAPVAEVPRRLYPPLTNVTAYPEFNAVVKAESKNTKEDASMADMDLLVVPLTDAQISTLYHNPQLQANEEFVEAFLQSVDQRKHEFYEILMNYYRSRNRLNNAEHDIETLQTEVQNSKEVVWEMEKKNLVLQGQCADRAKVTGEHSYVRAVFHEESSEMLSSLLNQIRSTLHEQLALSSYEAQFTRLHVEAYLYQLYQSKPQLLNIPPNSPITVRLSREVGLYNQLIPLKTCLNILFMFMRKPSRCPVFFEDVQKWIIRLSSTLLRVADREDHLYLLNHILRCPGGVGRWAVPCVQVLAPPLSVSSSLGAGMVSQWDPLLDHFLAMLQMTLVSVKKREELLLQLKVMITPQPEAHKENPWILVDSDGEEDEDPENSWHMLQENDLVALLNQMPVSMAFGHVLGVTSSLDNKLAYNPPIAVSESAILRLFAFATCVTCILEAGLQTYSMSRYRQLNKRLARNIRYTVWYIADHMEATGALQLSTRVQVEFDSFFIKAVTILLSANKFGAWQFLSDLPYSQVSLPSMWRLLWKMHLPDEKRSLFTISLKEITRELADPDSILAFEDRLVNMATSEALYLLNTFANMARSRDDKDQEFITLVALEIYEIAYISEHTRDFCNKQGRELLASVLYQHPHIMSDLLSRTAQTMASVGRVAVFLYKGLPVSLWRPTTRDLAVLQTWLVEHPLDSAESELARTIIEQLNWGFDPESDGASNKLWLDESRHRYMATVVMSAYVKHLSGRHFANNYTIRQMGPWVRSTNTDEDKMATWLWERALHLHLHASTQAKVHVTTQQLTDHVVIPSAPGSRSAQGAAAPSASPCAPDLSPSAPGQGQFAHSPSVPRKSALAPGQSPPAPVQSPSAPGLNTFEPELNFEHDLPNTSGQSGSSRISAYEVIRQFAESQLPDIATDDKFKIIRKGLKKNFPLANYFMLVMTKYGHNLGDFCQEGLEHLEKLVEHGYHLPAIHTLSLIMPLIFYKTEYLYTNTRFHKILEQILYLDNSKGGMFFSEFPGPITTHFAAMIQNHINQGFKSDPNSVIIEFWLKILTRLSRWYTDRNVLYVLDTLIKSSTQLGDGALDMCLEFFYTLQKTQQVESDSGLLGNLSSWFSSSQGSPSSMMADSRSWPGLSWLAYAVLNAEERIEQESGAWIQLQQAMRETDASGAGVNTLDSAIKIVSKQQGKKQIQQHKLAIYRWAQQAIDTPASDPVLPLLWQRFFLLYLNRPVLIGGLRERSSVGDKFFEGGSYLSMMKSMKQKLRDTSNHYGALAKETSDEMTSLLRESEDTLSSLERDVRCGQLQAKLNVFNPCIRMYDALCFWLDEPVLHNASLYLPSLPADYEAERLLTIIQGDRTPWNQAVLWQEVADDLTKLASDWTSLFCDSPQQPHATIQQLEDRKTPQQRILERLKRTDEIVPPPKLPKIKAPVPEVSDTVLVEKQSLLFSMRSDFNSLVECARAYHTKVSKHVALDHQYVEWLPRLYSNKPTSITLSVPCRALINPLHSCRGPAALSTIYEGMKEDQIISRKVDENRAEYKQLLIEALLPPSQHVCSSAVHIEQTLTKLITLAQTSKTQQLKSTLQDIGVTLFYHITTFISDDTKFYPPTKQFFTSCIEILGQEFIRSNPNQAQPLMQAILQNCNLLSVLSPNFNPTASPELFLSMYGEMLNVPPQYGTEVAFTMLSKFDVKQWLHAYNPPLSQRLALVDIIKTALMKCGQKPAELYRMVFEVYRSHLESVLTFSFPDTYHKILQLLLEGSAREQMNPIVWEDFVKVLGCSKQTNEVQIVDEKGAQIHEPLIRCLRSDNLESSIKSLSQCLSTERTATESGNKYGLYPKWKPYMNSIVAFSTGLIKTCTSMVLRDIQEGRVDSQLGIKTLWDMQQSIFWPWLEPYEKMGAWLSPWILADSEHASHVLDTWLQILVSMHHQLSPFVQAGSEQVGVMKLLWQLYANRLSLRGLPEHYSSLLHTHLTETPWLDFCPTLIDLQAFNKILDSNESMCSDFLCHVTCAVGWKAVLHYVIDPERSGFETATLYHAQLFHLLVRLGAHALFLQEDTGLIQLLAQSEEFSWDVYLDGSSFQLAAESYCHSCDVDCIMVERTSNSAAVIRLLKKASGFYNSCDVILDHPDLEWKRVLHVKCMVQLMCKCTRKPDANLDALGIGLSNLLTQVETVVSTVVHVDDQNSSAIGLCKEALNILNNCNPQGKSASKFLTVILQWIEDSHTSPLLYPLMHAACLNLASLPYMLTIVEACMDGHFTCFQGEMGSTRDGGWGRILSSLQVPELNQTQFLQQAVSNGAYLTLFAYILQRLPLSQDITDEKKHLENLVSWTGQVRPSSENEHKLFLWWTRILELAIRQCDMGGAPSDVKQKLNSFSQSLWLIGEDKVSAGLLGAIGLGKRSQLSLRFRVICKCLAGYVSAQLPNNLDRPRLNTTDHGFIQNGGSSPRGQKPSRSDPAPSPQALQYHSHIESLLQNKEYVSHKEDIEFYLSYVGDNARSLREVHALFVKLVSALYPEQGCLVILRQ